MAWSLRTFRGLQPEATAANLNQLRENLDLLKLHAHGGAPGDGALLLGGAEFVQIVPWFPYSDVNWATLSQDSSDGNYLHSILTTDTNALNNECAFRVSLKRGTWNIDVIGRKTSASGIATVYLDDVSKGTLDFYNGGTQENAQLTITGFSVPALAIAAGQILKFKITSKNASSSNYACGIRFIQLRRTGA